MISYNVRYTSPKRIRIADFLWFTPKAKVMAADFKFEC